MNELKFHGDFTVPYGSVQTGLSLFLFKENDVEIIYSPALDVSGYGKTESEAKQSFEISLGEFFRYTINKRTFDSELKRLGWKVTGKKLNKKYKQPLLDKIIQENDYLGEILREKEFQKIDSQINFPAIA